MSITNLIFKSYFVGEISTNINQITLATFVIRNFFIETIINLTQKFIFYDLPLTLFKGHSSTPS